MRFQGDALRGLSPSMRSGRDNPQRCLFWTFGVQIGIGTGWYRCASVLPWKYYYTCDTYSYLIRVTWTLCLSIDRVLNWNKYVTELIFNKTWGRPFSRFRQKINNPREKSFRLSAVCAFQERNQNSSHYINVGTSCL